tara:strand:- start:89 stop:1846 length:1758 start_codon:yes stop_codon:yes gene_type:complete
MINNLNVRWVLITGALFFGLWFSYPSFFYYSSSDNQDIDKFEERTIDLGLDLKGGLHIILELDEKKFLTKLVKQNLSKNSKNEYESLLNEAVLLAEKNKIDLVLQLQRLARQKNILLNKFFSNLSKSTDNSEIINAIKEQKTYSMSSILEVMRNRIEEHDQYGLGEPSIQKLGENRLMVELAGIDDAERAKKYIQRTADFELALVRDSNLLLNNLDKINEYIINEKLEMPSLDSLIYPYGGEIYINEKYHLPLSELFNRKDIKNLIKSNNKIVWNNDPIIIDNFDNPFESLQIRKLYLVSSKPAITGGMIKTPKAVVSEFGSTNAGSWVVNLDMTKEGRKKWSRFTGANIDKRVAIILDNKVFMAPYIRDKISTGSTQISGFADMQEAKDIAGILKAGELPAPINIVQTNYIGPSLGEDAIYAGKISMIIGIILVLIFMIIYYQFSGLIASFALCLNLIIVFGVLVSMNAVLTLPGIAGLLLTIGMTIDANVIIFERIREEIANQKLPINAIRSGYKRAFETILDANITTLMTAFVLSFIGSGPIKGFATTLSVGIICSMFTAVFVTKTIFYTFVKNKKTKKLSI